MGFLGLDWFESKETKKFKDDAYLHMVFPYGKRQEEKITSLLMSLFPNVEISELKYNYIVTKQRLTNIDIYKLTAKEHCELLEDLRNHFIHNDVDINLFISLAIIDLKIKDDLNYPNSDEIKMNSLALKNNNTNC